MSVHKLLPMLIVVFVILGIADVNTKPTKPPLRLRLNSKVISKIFTKHDQQLLTLFQDMPLGDFKINDDYTLTGVNASLGVQGGDSENFDFKLSFNEADYLGLQSSQLLVNGTGTLTGKDGEEQITFQAPIDLFKLVFDFENVLTKLGTPSKNLAYKDTIFEISDSKVEVTSSGSNAKLLSGDFKIWLKDKLKDALAYVKDETLQANPEKMMRLPITSIVPLIGIYYASLSADTVIFSDQYIEFQYSPLKFKLLSDKAYDRLKDIESDFEEPAPGEPDRAVQLLVDENVINSIFSHFASMDTMYSIRKVFAKDPRFAVFLQLLTTSTVGMVLPSFKEDYGDGKPLDLIGTASHELFSERIDNAQFSGISIDQKGILRATINLAAQIIVEKTPGKWEDTRQFFATVQFKGKVYINETNLPNKSLSILPKGIEVTTFKIFKGDEEMFLEQILTQSLLNAQVDQIRQKFQPINLGLSHLPNPKELQCLGFNLTDSFTKIRKGQIQLDITYEEIDLKDDEFCKKFEFEMREAPMQAFQQFSNQLAGMQGFANKMGMGGLPGISNLQGMGSDLFSAPSDAHLEDLAKSRLGGKKPADSEAAPKEELKKIDL